MTHLSSPSVSASASISAGSFKRLGPQFLPVSEISGNTDRIERGDLLPDIVLPSASQTVTVCNPARESTGGATATKIIYLTTSAHTAASGTLTLTGAGVENEEVVVGSITYVLKAAVTTTANEVLIGADEDETAENLRNAINANGLGGYGTDTTANAAAWASVSGAVLTVTARVGGTAGNSIATTTDVTGATWSAVTLENGADDADVDSGIPILLSTPYTFSYDGDNVPTLYLWCAEAVTATVLFHGA